MMDQDDPEKRLADLERQHAEAVERPRVDPKRKLDPKRKRLAHLLLIFMAVVPPAIFLTSGAYDSYAYHVGTPATATKVHCERAGRGIGCYGEWSVGGESSSGTIEGISHSDGSSLNVHVHDGTAYTAGAGLREFRLVAIAVGFYIIVGAAIVWALVSRRRAARRR